MRCLICVREETQCIHYVCVTCSTPLDRPGLYSLLLDRFNSPELARGLVDGGCIADLTAGGSVTRDLTAAPRQWIISDFLDALGEGYQEDCEIILIFGRDGLDGMRWQVVECVDVKRLDYIMEFRRRLDGAENKGKDTV